MSEAGSLSTEADGSRTSPPSPGRGAAEAELEEGGRRGETRPRGDGPQRRYAGSRSQVWIVAIAIPGVAKQLANFGSI